MALCENILSHLSFGKYAKYLLFSTTARRHTQSEDDEAHRAAGGLSILFYYIKFVFFFLEFLVIRARTKSYLEK